TRSGSTLNNQYPCDGLSFGPCVPTLEVTSSAYQVTFSIASPPANGTLKDSGGNEIACTPVPDSRGTSVCETPMVLQTSVVTYTPNAGFNGSDSFQFQVEEGGGADVGVISITVGEPPGPPSDCANGRGPGC
ncbi:MAG: hypothetical protein GY859_40305, partial [Desulfobacterales bacterium]|nr:hypothetical protein [Desulfobacterales bacterium]